MVWEVALGASPRAVAAHVREVPQLLSPRPQRRRGGREARLGAFLLPDGVVEPPCNGACDPE